MVKNSNVYQYKELKALCIILIFISTRPLYAQQSSEIRGSVNTQSLNDVFPSISGDGNTLAFMNDYTDDGSFITLISRKEAGGRWNQGAELTELNPSRLNAPGGYCLSFDGNTLVYSTIKGERIGGYDLWYIEYSEGKWSSPRNLGAPVNSTLDDSYPSFSPDDSQLYFTRCSEINESGGTECKIFVATRKKGRIKGWEDPVELSSKINSGNSLMPRMLSDNITLVFSSDKAGGKGGLDWYLSRLNSSGSWSNPINLDYINTAENDFYFTMYYRTDKVILSEKNERDFYNIVEMDVPERYQPYKVVIKTGAIINTNGRPVDADVRARDFNTGESVVFTFPDTETGKYTIVIPEGKIYDFSIVPKRGSEFYHSEILDYTDLRGSMRESSDYILKNSQVNQFMALNGLKYLPESAQIDPRCEEEIARLVRLLRRNENFKIEIAAYQDSIITDSIPRPGLSEVIADTTRWDEYIYEYEYQYQYDFDEDSLQARFPEFTSIQLDSILTVWNDSLSITRYDTLLAESLLASLVGVDTIEHVIDTLEHVDIKYTYHNDLTQKRAQNLADMLIAQDVPPERVIPVGYGDKRRPLTAIKEEEWGDLVEVIFRR